MRTDGDTIVDASAIEGEQDSVERVRGLLSAATTSILRACFKHNDAARVQWQTTAAKYRERWAQGDFDGVAPVLADVMKWLRAAEIDPFRNPEVRALLNDPFVVKVRGRVPTVELDFVAVFRQIASAIRRPITTKSVTQN